MRDPLFAAPPAGPDSAWWAAAVLRALHPLRWGLGLAGLAATVAVAAVAQAVFEGRVPRFADWFGDPGRQARALGEHLAGRSFGGLIVRLGAVATVVAGLWSLIGAWIARHELLARHRGREYEAADPIDPGPTRLLARKPKDLVLCFVAVLSLCAVLLLPVFLAGGLNQLGGGGAVLVAVLLPVVLVADLVLLCLLMGLAAWPLMPVAIAVENSDVFDALSRGYNYAYTRPVRFVLLTAVALAIAAVPPAAILWLLAGPVEDWLEAAGHPAVWAAAALSVSLFWSLQTLVYLHLRTSVYGVDANEITREVEPAPAAQGPAKAAPQPATPEPATRIRLVTHVLIFGAMVATWVLTDRLFARFGGEDAGWLGWGMGEHFRPPADGLYWYASTLAGFWGAIWLAAPILVAVRRAFRPDSRDSAANSPP